MNEEIELLIEEDEEEEPIDTSALDYSTYAYHAVIFILDFLSGVIVGYMTYFYYGVIWFLSGAVAFFMHHKNWESPTNNEKQLKNATNGMIVSVAAVALMGIASGAVFILKNNNLIDVPDGYVSLAVEVSVISLFIWNGYKFAMYKFSDDSFSTNRQVAKEKGKAHKRKQLAKAAGKIVRVNKSYLEERDIQRTRHGAGAVDAALGRLGVPINSVKASKVEVEELKENPPKGGN